MKSYKLFPWFLTAFVTFLLISSVIAGRLVQMGPFVVTGAIFLFPFTYILGDLFTEVYGFAVSRRVVWYGALANVIMLLMFAFVSSLPAPVFFKDGAAAFSLVIGLVPRIVIASIVAYIVGSYANDTIMSKMKKWMVKWDPNHKHLWMRTVGSTIGGQFFDGLLFTVGVFLFVVPAGVLVQMILVQWVVKSGIEFIMTPITYLVVSKVKKVEGIDIVATDETSYKLFSIKDEIEKDLKLI